MKDAGDFDKVTILKPYSFVLVDEDKETVAELLLIDDDTLLVDDELLKGLDKELDEFLKICWRNKYVRLPGMALLKQLSFIKRIIGSKRYSPVYFRLFFFVLYDSYKPKFPYRLLVTPV